MYKLVDKMITAHLDFIFSPVDPNTWLSEARIEIMGARVSKNTYVFEILTSQKFFSINILPKI